MPRRPLERFPCPVCGVSEMEEGDYVICHNCKWENDPNQMRRTDIGGANYISLDYARIYWQLTQKPIPWNLTPEMDAAFKLVDSELNRRKYAKKFGHDKYVQDDGQPET